MTEVTRLFDNRIQTEERPVTLEEAAKFLGKSPETIRRYSRLKINGFPSFKIGRSYMVLLSSLTAWCKNLERNNV